MFNLFRLNKKMPPFDRLKLYEHKDLYFRRIAPWSWSQDNTIYVIDLHKPRIITMDPWPQKVFLAATGQKTVTEYIYDVANEYRGKIPDLLDETIIHEIETLVREKIIALHPAKQRPDKLHDEPNQSGNKAPATDFLLPWQPSTEDQTQQLQKEINNQHVLYGKMLKTIARRQDNDDVLFEVSNAAFQYAVVHLTWKQNSEEDARYPLTITYQDWKELFEKRIIPDHDEWQKSDG